MVEPEHVAQFVYRFNCCTSDEQRCVSRVSPRSRVESRRREDSYLVRNRRFAKDEVQGGYKQINSGNTEPDWFAISPNFGELAKKLRRPVLSASRRIGGFRHLELLPNRSLLLEAILDCCAHAFNQGALDFAKRMDRDFRRHGLITAFTQNL